MDRLARNAMLARQANMTYGKWKALQPVVTTEQKQEEIPDDWKTCPECGTRFAPKGKKKFCGYDCQRVQRQRRRTAYMRQYRDGKKEGAEDGK